MTTVSSASPVAKSTRGFTLIELLVVIAIIAILAAILFPVFAKAREKARQTQCINNCKQVTTAVLMYVQDNEETLPSAQSFWSDIDVPAKVKQCSTAGKKVTNAYVGNGLLNSVGMGEMDFPDQTMLVADGTRFTESTESSITDPLTGQLRINRANMAYAEKDIAKRHNGASIVGYLDGHVALTKEAYPWIPVNIWDFEDSPQLCSWNYSNGSATTGSNSTMTTTTTAFSGKSCAQWTYDETNDRVALGVKGYSPYPTGPVLNAMPYQISYAVKANGDDLRLSFIFVDRDNINWDYGWRAGSPGFSCMGELYRDTQWHEYSYSLDKKNVAEWSNTSSDTLTPRIWFYPYISTASGARVGTIYLDNLIMWADRPSSSLFYRP